MTKSPAATSTKRAESDGELVRTDPGSVGSGPQIYSEIYWLNSAEGLHS